MLMSIWPLIKNAFIFDASQLARNMNRFKRTAQHLANYGNVETGRKYEKCKVKYAVTIGLR